MKEHFAKASVKIKVSGVNPSIKEKGKEKKMSGKKKGFQTFKTIAALRMASRDEGVSVREMAEHMKLSNSAVYYTLSALEECGEIARKENRYYSDVYRDKPSGDFVRKTDEDEKSNGNGVIEIVADTMGSVYSDLQEAYPGSVFGAQAKFIHMIGRNMLSAMFANIQERLEGKE